MGDWLDTYVQTDASPDIPSSSDIRSAYDGPFERSPNVSVTPEHIPSSQLANVTVTVTDPETTAPIDNAIVSIDDDATGTTNASGITTLSLRPDSESEPRVTVSADGYSTASRALSVYDPIRAPVNVTAVGLDSETITANTTSEHQLTVSVANVSNDRRTDQITVVLPDALSLSEVNDVAVTDARDTAIAIDDVDADKRTLSVAVSPGNRSATQTVTIDAWITVTAAPVQETVEAVLTTDTVDSSNGRDTGNTTLIVAPPADAMPVIVGDSPVQDLDGDGVAEDVTGDGVFDIVDINAFFQYYRDQTVQSNVDLFDFNGDGAVDVVDVSKLFQLYQQ